MASATGISPLSRTSPGAEKHVARIIRTYHRLAATIERISRRGIFFSGTSISLAAWGTTSKPTNMAGTTSKTEVKPEKEVNSGFAYSKLPMVRLPPRNSSPTSRMPPVATL